MKVYKDIIQGSEEWHELRKLKFTASKATPVGANGAGLKTLVAELVAKAIVPEDPDARYVSPEMARGNELEPIARTAYEFKYGQDVEVVGFVEYDEHIGVSPDGFVGKNGLIEIKCRSNAKHLVFMLTRKVDSSEWNQCQFQLFVTGRKWVDLCYYNPDFRNSLIVERIRPDEKYFAKLEAGLKAGKKMLLDYLNDEKVKDELNPVEWPIN